MAFRKLTEADCGQPNALVQLSSHLSQNHAISDPGIFADSSDQLVEQFLQETRNVPQSFRMDDLMREMNEIEAQRQLLPPVPASAVKDQLLDDQWALQYIEDGKHFNVNENQDSIWAEILDPGIRDLAAENAIWTDEFLEENERQLVQDNATGQEAEETATSSDQQYSKFMKFMKELGDEEQGSLDDIGKTWAEEYVSVLPEDSKIANTWSEEHRDDLNANFWNKLQGEWKKLSEEQETPDHPWISEFNDYYDSYSDYNFTEENPMSDLTNPLEQGKQMLQQGDLPSAVLCFEVAVKKEPENPEAWQLLGISQAENEQDPNAICALKRCLELEPTNLKALMGLAVSYTNENYPRQACQTLVSWLKENPQYRSLVPPDLNLSGQVSSIIKPSQHKLVQDLFIKAAQLNPTNIDYEVQCGLGVLFNLSSEYNKAADCFRAALGVKSEDARLWNRLGATLANGSKPEEAVDAYHRALELEPGFIRARYNVGITCINLSAYREAAEHFLLALNQQARGKDVRNMAGLSQMSETIWSTLRMCVSLMNRADLRPALDNRDLEALNKAFNIQDT